MIRRGIGVQPYTVDSSFIGLLDTYTDAAAAYSVRKLRAAYTGSAIRVRRSSDNTEQDIGFDTNGNLDESALTTFVGAGNGFMTTWYDQSGNGNNATQSTAANQPRIVNGGNIDKKNNKPNIVFDGSNDNLLSSLVIDPLFIVSANTPTTTSLFKTIFSADTSNSVDVGAIYFGYGNPTRSPLFARTTTSDSIGATDFIAIGSAIANNVMNLFTGTRTSTSIFSYINGSQVATDTTSNSLRPLGGVNSGRFLLGSGYYSNLVLDQFQGNISEIVFYTSQQSSNRSGIESNINNYFSIY